MRQAKEQEKESRDMSWAGRRGQAERAALAEMNSSAQGRNAAEYAVQRECACRAPSESPAIAIPAVVQYPQSSGHGSLVNGGVGGQSG